jgi:hypothetical protein
VDTRTGGWRSDFVGSKIVKMHRQIMYWSLNLFLRGDHPRKRAQRLRIV